MITFLVLLPALAASASAAPCAQRLTHVRLEVAEAPSLAARLENDGFDVVEGSVGMRSLELVVSPESRRVLESQGYRLETLAIGRPYLEIQREQQAQSPDAVPSGYPTLTQIQAQMSAAAAAFPAIAALVDLTAALGMPATWEGRHLWAVKISDNVAQDEDEPAVLIVSCHHAREIVTPVIALHAIDQLTSQYATSSTVKALVDAHEIWVAPVWNPDGYEHVFNVDNLWRKNRRNNGGGSFGVDLNRNYSFGWTTACSGSTSTSSDTYKGPSAGSEQETQSMVALGGARRFAKLFDYHSYASEVRYGYGCLSHPFTAFMLSEAQAFSQAGGYGGATALSCCTGGDMHWHNANTGTHAFLWETHTQFQPTYASAQAEASMLWPGVVALLQRPISLSGHVTDACSGAPIQATVTLAGVNFQNGEKNASGGPFGRYHHTLPAGSYTVQFSAAGYVSQSFPCAVTAASAQVLDVALMPAGPSAYCTAKTNSAGCVPALSFTGSPSASAGSGFVIGGANELDGKNGLLFYSKTGALAQPFQGGWLCLAAPTKRTPVQTSGGLPPCGGSYSFDFNAWIASGTDPALVAGQKVWAQYWSRDPGFAPPGNTNLTNALAFELCP